MSEARETERRDAEPTSDDDADRGLMIEAGMLAVLVVLALVFVTYAPS